MLVLVLGASFPVMFIGWEGVGLCSYLLIGFWFTKPSAADAGKKAFIVNRIGDFGFILGMLSLFWAFGTLDFQEIASKVALLPADPASMAGATVLTAATLLLFLGATGKSAQLPLYVWLPDAMEGPTPVSALIHAATMVTAGVYMIGRNAVLFSHAPFTLEVVAIVGVATALFAGTIGLVQNDIKRVLAYSTVSQLGYMFLAMGVGAFAGGIFHLYTHAFFKALLFLGSGAVIHALHGEQDLRHMGGLRKHLPVTFYTFLIGTIAIAGIPPLAGFLLEGRDPLEDLRAAATGAVGRGGRGRVPDRHLHVPPAVPGVLRRTADAAATAHGSATPHGALGRCRARHGAPSAATAAHLHDAPRADGHCAGRAGDWIGARGLRRRAARARRAATGSRRSSSRASRRWARTKRVAAEAPAAEPRRRSRRGGARRDGTELSLMAFSTLVALARHRPGHGVLPAAAGSWPTRPRPGSAACTGCCWASTTWTSSTTPSSCSRSSASPPGCSGAAWMPG